jgi:excisionase family DNA binding protein
MSLLAEVLLLPCYGPSRCAPRRSERLLTVRQVAERLGVCTATVYTLCATGELPHLRVLNAIRVEPVDIEAFIAARRREKR